MVLFSGWRNGQQFKGCKWMWSPRWFGFREVLASKIGRRDQGRSPVYGYPNTERQKGPNQGLGLLLPLPGLPVRRWLQAPRNELMPPSGLAPALGWAQPWKPQHQWSQSWGSGESGARAAGCAHHWQHPGKHHITSHTKMVQWKKNVIIRSFEGWPIHANFLPPGVIQELALWPGLQTLLSSLGENYLHQRPFYGPLVWARTKEKETPPPCPALAFSTFCPKKQPPGKGDKSKRPSFPKEPHSSVRDHPVCNLWHTPSGSFPKGLQPAPPLVFSFQLTPRSANKILSNQHR